MHIKTKNRLYYSLAFFTFIALGIAIVLYNLSSNISFFLTPTELLQKPIYSEIKLGGYAKNGSLKKINIDEVEFEITDRVNHIKVRYKGPIPTIFREGQGVVITGNYSAENIFYASELLAKHDEKYMPKSVKKNLSQ